jgi:hypothetical protein
MGLTIDTGVTVESGVSLLTLSGSINTTGNQGRFTTPASTNLALGTSAFTIEGWFKPTAKTNNNPTLINNGNFGANRWQLNDRNGTNTKFDFAAFSASMMSSTTTPVNGTWYYLSVTRSGSTFRLHVNGVQEATATNAGNIDGGGSQTIYFAKDNSQTVTSWNGQMTNIRIVIGTALYGAASYTPPTSPNTAVANTQVLINAYPSQPYKDYSTNNFTIAVTTVSGQPSWSATSPLTNQYSQ